MKDEELAARIVEAVAQAQADTESVVYPHEHGRPHYEDAAARVLSLLRARASEGRGWVTVTDDPKTWPTDADVDVVVQMMCGETRQTDHFSGGYARGWIEEDFEVGAYRETRITHWLRIPKIGEPWPPAAAPAAPGAA